MFLLAGSEITFDSLTSFIAASPTEKIPTTDDGWRKVPVFGPIFAKAEKGIVTQEDRRIFERTSLYWKHIYASYDGRIRSSVTLGVYSMLDAFRGRDIPAIISSDTNLTPEKIISEGKIVVLDFPVNEIGHTGVLVQSAWKYLFQTALLRYSMTSDQCRRPVFLWEDEFQHFVTEFDHRFQTTARSSRVSHVVLTQNVPGILMQLGRQDAASSIFGNLNTKIFHANSDQVSAQWASSCFGQVIRHRLSISQKQPDKPTKMELGDALGAWLNPQSSVSVSSNEEWEPVVRPEEFSRLRTGGPENDFQVDAFITWVGAGGENELNYTSITFNQNPEL